MKLINKREICEQLPHNGAMCLLDKVISANESEMICSASSHLDPENPLRINGKLFSVAGIEYAAQAVALHGRLRDIDIKLPPIIGFLASIRNLKIKCNYLDEHDDALIIKAVQNTLIDDAVIYDFQLLCKDDVILTGRMMTKLMQEAPKND